MQSIFLSLPFPKVQITPCPFGRRAQAKKYLEHQIGGRESVIFTGTLPVRLAIRILDFAIQEGSGFEEATT